MKCTVNFRFGVSAGPVHHSTSEIFQHIESLKESNDKKTRPGKKAEQRQVHVMSDGKRLRGLVMEVNKMAKTCHDKHKLKTFPPIGT